MGYLRWVLTIVVLVVLAAKGRGPLVRWFRALALWHERLVASWKRTVKMLRLIRVTRSYARGGVLPERAPGDRAGPFMLSPGEVRIPPEAMRLLGGEDALRFLNVIATPRRRREPRWKRLLRRTPPPSPGYQGRIDADIRAHVAGMEPSSLGQRVAMEETLQSRRDAGQVVLGVAGNPGPERSGPVIYGDLNVTAPEPGAWQGTMRRAAEAELRRLRQGRRA